MKLIFNQVAARDLAKLAVLLESFENEGPFGFHGALRNQRFVRWEAGCSTMEIDLHRRTATFNGARQSFHDLYLDAIQNLGLKPDKMYSSLTHPLPWDLTVSEVRDSLGLDYRVPAPAVMEAVYAIAPTELWEHPKLAAIAEGHLSIAHVVADVSYRHHPNWSNFGHWVAEHTPAQGMELLRAHGERPMEGHNFFDSGLDALLDEDNTPQEGLNHYQTGVAWALSTVLDHFPAPEQREWLRKDHAGFLALLD